PRGDVGPPRARPDDEGPPGRHLRSRRSGALPGADRGPDRRAADLPAADPLLLRLRRHGGATAPDRTRVPGGRARTSAERRGGLGGRVAGLTWLGHSTVLLELDGVRLLTDPVLVPWVGPVRRVVVEPGPISPVDAVLVSHVHYDHLDFASLRRVRAERFVVPAGAGRLLARRGLANVVELARGEGLSVGPVDVVATDAEHSARRGLVGAEIPALGYLISGS